MSSLVVKNHRPWQFAAAIVILSMFLASFTWLLLDKGHWALIYEQIGDNQEWKKPLGSQPIAAGRTPRTSGTGSDA